VTTTTADVDAPSTRSPRLMLVGCCLALFIISLDATIVNVALPTMQTDLHASVSGLQWIIDCYSLVLASLLLVAGSTGDRIGRRRMFQMGLVVFAVGSLACSLAPNLDTLIAFRMLQAVGGAMLQPNALSTITNVITDPTKRAHAIGVWAGVFGIAAASGPILGGILVATIGWRAIFWVNLPIAAAAFVLAASYAPETRAPRPRRADPAGQVLLIVALATLTYAVIEGPTDGWGSVEIVGLFAAALVGLASFVGVEHRKEEPLLELRFFRSPPFTGAASMATLAFAILAGFLFLNTLYLQEVRGDSALMAGVATLPATVVIAVISPLTGRLVARHGSRFPMTAAGFLLAGGALVLSQDRVGSSYQFLAAGYVLLGLGFALINPPITNTAVAGMPKAQAGVASAVATSSRQLGNVLGVAIIGSVVTSQLHRSLGHRADTSRLPPETRAALGNAGTGTSLRVPTSLPGALHANQILREVFTAASHAGWDLAVAAGVAIAVIAWLTTSTRARAIADTTMNEPGIRSDISQVDSRRPTANSPSKPGPRFSSRERHGFPLRSSRV
jgi:EmrB/QacA subfamily drug resistance transporter